MMTGGQGGYRGVGVGAEAKEGLLSGGPSGVEVERSVVGGVLEPGECVGVRVSSSAAQDGAAYVVQGALQGAVTVEAREVARTEANAATRVEW
jgi:hypothetical protein